ncbi:MAG: hypothetical protein J4203_02040 [Candidatus Diapherotrites archaeon]|uniref:Uncharacterized protein n=1 Tax=Candidatus Iainarchaeum sp. TaxID=3101447 RepID=A0A8T4L5Q7_9ARCH|nr:hypothetical protein [Candidatus Diapherotrites archaeon]
MEAGLMRRGFLFTLSILLLLGFLLAFSFDYSSKPRSIARELTASLKAEKAAFVADDLAADVNRLLGIGLDINSLSATRIVTLHDRLPSGFNRSQLTGWEQFMETGFDSLLSSTIDLNTGAMTDANAELLFSNGIQYLFASTDANSLQLFVPGGDTNIIALDLNVFVNDDLNYSVPWTTGSGDVNVTLRYSDHNAVNAFVSSGLLSSTTPNQYILRYSQLSTDALIITVGQIAGSEAGLRIEHSIDDPSTLARIAIAFTLASESKPLTVSANLDLNYAQADFNLGRKLVLARG